MRLNDVSLIGFALYLLCGLAVTYNVYNCPANKNDKEVTLLHYLTLIFCWPIALVMAAIYWVKIQSEIRKQKKLNKALDNRLLLVYTINSKLD